jgi:hypothetical protein
MNRKIVVFSKKVLALGKTAVKSIAVNLMGLLLIGCRQKESTS